MSDSHPQRQREVVKLYTRARKFPQLIGRTPDGRRLFGGPYTTTQFIGAGAAAFVLWRTTGLWARSSMPLNAALFVGLIWGTVYGLGKLPQGGRNPLSMVMGVARAASASTSLKTNGQVTRRPRMHALDGVVTVMTQGPAAPAAVAVSAPEAAPDTVVDLPPVRPAPSKRAARRWPVEPNPRRVEPLHDRSRSVGAPQLVALAGAPSRR